MVNEPPSIRVEKPFGHCLKARLLLLVSPEVVREWDWMITVGLFKLNYFILLKYIFPYLLLSVPLCNQEISEDISSQPCTTRRH